MCRTCPLLHRTDICGVVQRLPRRVSVPQAQVRFLPPLLMKFTAMKILTLIIKQKWFDAILSGEKTVETRQLQDIIQQVSIPMETVTEVTEKGPKTYDRKVFPGYVLVKMVMTDDAWYIIKNVRGVTGFVTSGSTKPTPLTEDEVIQLGVEKREIVVGYKVGDTVRIMDGPLTSFSGIVEELDVEKNRVRVTVSMFGRETPVDLELDQVELSTD